ncbi:hypothetical protein HN51_055532 [Arachis hypogaea]
MRRARREGSFPSEAVSVTSGRCVLSLSLSFSLSLSVAYFLSRFFYCVSDITHKVVLSPNDNSKNHCLMSSDDTVKPRPYPRRHPTREGSSSSDSSHRKRAKCLYHFNDVGRMDLILAVRQRVKWEKKYDAV